MNLNPLFPSGLRAIALMLALFAAVPAVAGTVTTRYGSQDDFGLGVASGDSFLASDLAARAGNETDAWGDGGVVASLTGSFTVPLLGARLDVFSGGWGHGGQAQVLFNDQLVGLLSDGDIDTLGDNFAWVDSFDLIPFLGLITGMDTVKIVTATADDGGVLGYIKLILQTQNAGNGGNNVPEPISILLVGAALAAGLAARHRRI